ncbi:MAG: DinB family protein [Bacteroidetes bacterium]|nr:DinB family protein [Bacteroidota bacterium]MBS1757785.1 DinB family protein [Bacteroidota bacterium]
MKEIISQYAGYNLWANKRICDTVMSLSPAQLHHEIESSFTSIYNTLLHLWSVESVWWQRIKLVENPVWPGNGFEGSIAELTAALLHGSKQWHEWVEAATEAALYHEFIYRNTKREQYKQPAWQMLHHLFNHQTYHRGQLVTMLRQVGVSEVPATDLIVYWRKK